jgi:hypothetical protein
MFLTKLLKLKYHPTEAKWINNLSKLILTSHPTIINDTFTKSTFVNKYKVLNTISVHDDGHTFHTDMYTKAIVSSMLCNEEWSETHVHLNYDVVWDTFYRRGFHDLGNTLLTTPHEIELLKDENLVYLVRNCRKGR